MEDREPLEGFRQRLINLYMTVENPHIRAAFQGEAGAFSHEAVRRLLGSRATVLPCQRFDEVFAALRDGQVGAAVIPIENTLHGSVHENYDHLLEFNHRIVAETSVRIVHKIGRASCRERV